MQSQHRPHDQPLDSGADASTILIAEDHLDSREALRALLEAFGYRVLVAIDGRAP